jgi:hypothetical protein
VNPSSCKRLTQIELYVLIGIGLVAIAEVLVHFTHWEKRACYTLATFATVMTMNVLTPRPTKGKVLRGAVIAAVVLFVYFIWR